MHDTLFRYVVMGHNTSECCILRNKQITRGNFVRIQNLHANKREKKKLSFLSQRSARQLIALSTLIFILDELHI